MRENRKYYDEDFSDLVEKFNPIITKKLDEFFSGVFYSAEEVQRCFEELLYFLSIDMSVDFVDKLEYIEKVLEPQFVELLKKTENLER